MCIYLHILKEEQMSIRLSITLLVVLVVAGCTGTPRYGVSEASFAAPVLGIVTDDQLRVVEVIPNSAAEQAGVQVGDVLLDLTWIPSATPIPAETVVVPEAAGGVALDANATPIADGEVVTEPLPIPAPTILPEQYIEQGTVPFTDAPRIISLAGYGFPLKLRLQREGEVLELTITASTSVYHPLAPGEGTPTPIPTSYYYY
jgi:hypothetical protein